MATSRAVCVTDEEIIMKKENSVPKKKKPLCNLIIARFIIFINHKIYKYYKYYKCYFKIVFLLLK